MSSTNNFIAPKIVLYDETTNNNYKKISEMDQADLEILLKQAYIDAREIVRESDVGEPMTLLALLAVYGMQEVHALGFKSPSAIRAMAIKVAAGERRGTKGCLYQARREVIAAATQRRAEEKQVEEGADANGAPEKANA
ncbi:uncharacterized protein HMPREF1541_02204 [Cyphellophora europaea CBS 101466]|uniref:Uncharacterized protein n=1 Tax=Cyphellophora europaea (strain CBS 101466) TaxID=1220924 RepID=W2S2V2_CYPE1|nr:uncharacterized protein HMPREF1541_02204 [Cyphellophora europaea CBS 101466]ETN43046.1 hypothetical protein HMPREF1541_02204 [Cyphellophora europaea CBS 101466]